MIDNHAVWNIGKSEFTAEEVKEMSKAYKQLMGNCEMGENEREEALKKMMKFFEKINSGVHSRLIFQKRIRRLF